MEDQQHQIIQVMEQIMEQTMKLQHQILKLLEFHYY